MAKARYSTTERLGILAVDTIATREFKWIFREQTVLDMGIDAHLETVDDGAPTGRLIALQIKTGASYFDEQSATSIVFRGKNTHLEYWTKHALPVVVILHDPEKNESYWEVVTTKRVVKTENAWKLDIPKKQAFDVSSMKSLSQIADGPSETLRLNKLRLASSLMKEIIDGKNYFLEATEWINKTSGRGSVRIVSENVDGTEAVAVDWRNFYASFIPYETVFQLMFPWANFVPDHELYADAAYDRYLNENGIWDGEDNEFRIIDEDERDEYVRNACSPGIRPYDEDGSGEVVNYRLRLSVNDIGNSFLELDKFLTSDQPLLDKIM